ncbi:ABC transporter permease [Caviibacter abscessus]|uniref:ABC transporter permease n=1 Tax=Caviibacter abscessus TaxID=1766719 RepID=UPI00082BE976|nr:ABC-2 family transporter protein [Caviibacter abscessus]
MKFLKKQYSIALNQVLINFQYRFNFIAKVSIYLFQFFIIYFMWKSIYKDSELKTIGNYNYNEMIIYILITNISALVYNFNGIHRIGQLVRTGKLTTILLRPLSIIEESFSQYLGNKIFAYILSFLIIIFSNIKFKILSILYISSTFMMYFYLTMLIACLGFFIFQTGPLQGLFNGIFYILAGVYFPLNLLPGKIYNILKFNPFSLVSYVLANILENKLSYEQILIYLLASILWIITFRFILIKIIKKGLNSYEGMGA